MVLSSYSKINLSLLVNSKQKSGLHNIQSYFCLINLKDTIKIKKIDGKNDKINFIGPFSKFINKRDNSIKSVLVLLRKLKLISSFYSVVIKKNIPVFAGLGGGTSNAFTVMKYALKKKLSKKNLNIIEKKIGSDFELFFYKQGFLKNLGSIINQNIKHTFFFVLIKPPIKCSTREIYSKIKKHSSKTVFSKRAVKKRISFLNLLINSRNDLQSVVEKKHSRLKTILKNISFQKGCCFSRMTGSGSVCYGLFINQNSAKKARINLKKIYPKFWVSIAKTV
jgi:4-diphosphocytidyl-2-C-methyl-D-erythritol kinase